MKEGNGELIAILKEKQLDVLRLLSEGKGTKEIAELRSYSEHTVKQYVRDVFARLGVNDRLHAVGSCRASLDDRCRRVSSGRLNEVVLREGTLDDVCALIHGATPRPDLG